MSTTKELFHPTVIAINGVLITGGNTVGGFLAKTGGTITIVSQQGFTYIDAIPVTAGIYTPIPMFMPRSGGFTVTLLGGASGTLFT